MKISDKQAHQLVALLQSSLEKNVVGYLCYDIDTREAMLNEIISQQDQELVELNVPKKKPPIPK
jgi:hypothetical protein